jgi:hypothetical protein
MLSISADFQLLLHWLAWERNRPRPMNYSAGLGVASGALILGSSRIRRALLMTHERLPRMGTVCRKHTSDVRGLAWEAYASCWSGFSLQGVHRFESLRLSDMSIHLFMDVIK